MTELENHRFDTLNGITGLGNSHQDGNTVPKMVVGTL